METTIFKDKLEEKMHSDAIDVLCHEYPDKQQFIREKYLNTLRPMISDAQIRTYLPIFVTRKVKSLL